ncbi:MAG: ABC transporter permease [Verrucomicrobiales bacterium]|nr:ABC transporter permease [Verrucomicrobiales bacterium]
MKSLIANFAKEWSGHRWFLVSQCGFCLLCFALLYYKIDAAKYLSRGSFSMAFMSWPLFAIITANFLAFQLYTRESQSRTCQFLAGLPIPRWHILISKVVFCWFAVMLISLVYFSCIAAVTPQAQLSSWQSIIYPLVRLSTFNWFVVTVIFLVSMIGKYRWYVYLVIMAVLTYLNASGAATISLLQMIPALRLIEEERSLSDLSVLPWKLIFHTITTGCIAMIGILTIDQVVQSGQWRNCFTRVSNLSDRVVAAIVIISIPTLFLTFRVAINQMPARLDLEYFLAFTVDHQARSGATLVELSYYKVNPDDKAEEEKDRKMIREIAVLLENARRRLEPRWWPERWLIVKSPDVEKNESSAWAKQVSGDAVVFVANWERKENQKERTEIDFARSQLDCFIDSMIISARHRERHGWVTAGLPMVLISSATDDQSQTRKYFDLLSGNSLENWPGIIHQSKNSHIFSSGILDKIEKQLGEEEFNSWIREVGRLALAKPEVNTLFSLKRGAFFWNGLLRGSVAALDRRGFDPKPVIESMQNESEDEG